MLNIIYFILCYIVLSCTAFKCDNIASKRQEYAPIQIWPGNTLPYEVADTYTADDRKKIADSLQDLSDRTGNCVKFVLRTADHPAWARIERGVGCTSPVGKTVESGAQIISLGNNCVEKGVIQHEFLHSLGFNHEQTRPDRDDYVKIILENVEPGKQHNYNKDPRAKLQSDGLPYDYDSIMHYGYADFSINCLPMMVPVQESAKQWRYNMGKGRKLTDIDIMKVKKVYGCT